MLTPTAHEPAIVFRLAAILDEYATFDDDAWPEDLDAEFGHLRLQLNAHL
jgi:hypothetical protein